MDSIIYTVDRLVVRGLQVQIHIHAVIPPATVTIIRRRKYLGPEIIVLLSKLFIEFSCVLWVMRYYIIDYVSSLNSVCVAGNVH